MKPSHAYTHDLNEYENRRLQVLHSYKILDTPRESSFDDLTQSVASTLNVPYVKIAFIDADRIWCKSTVGFIENDAPLAGSLAQLALQNPSQVIQLNQLGSDSRVCYPSKLVSDPAIQSSAGIPIVSVDGFVLGIIAVFDTKARDFCQEEISLLQNRSKQITEMIENKRDADLLLDTLLEQREELRSKTIFNRIARTLIGSVGSKDELHLVIKKFMEATTQEFGWWAGQAWIEGEGEFNPTDWIFSTSAPASLLNLNKYPDTSISNFNDADEAQDIHETMIYSDLEISHLGWHPNSQQLEKSGARSFVELKINNNCSTALKILFVLPSPRALTHGLHQVLQNLVVLLPQIMKRARGAQSLIYRATHDSLTGLLNRRGLEESYPDELIDPNSNYFRSVFFFDIDRFKEINDTYGHAVGDQVLIEISKRLVKSSRPVDSVARIGGDEFVIVTPGFDTPQTLEATAQRLLQEINQPILIINQNGLDIRVSLGVSYMRSHHSLEHALKRADELMYKAKDAGGHRYFIEQFDSAFLVDSELFDSGDLCGLQIKSIQNAVDGITHKLYVSIDLPSFFAPLTISKIAEEIASTSHSFNRNNYGRFGLVINAPILGKMNQSNLDALLEMLEKNHHFSDLTYCIDTKMRTPQAINLAKHLNSQRLVKISLINFGLGENELQLVQEIKPSLLMIGQKMLHDENMKNMIIVKLIIAISEESDTPLVVFDGAAQNYRSVLSQHKNLQTIHN